MIRPPPRSPLFPYPTLFRSLELTVVRLADGEVSPYLTSVLEVGDQLELRGPIGGYFVWDAADTRPVVLEVPADGRSEEHTSELQSRGHLVCRLLLEKKKKKT